MEEEEQEDEEEGERRETPNEGKPVCGSWRGQRQGDWVIAVAILKRNTLITIFQRISIPTPGFVSDQVSGGAVAAIVTIVNNNNNCCKKNGSDNTADYVPTV